MIWYNLLAIRIHFRSNFVEFRIVQYPTLPINFEVREIVIHEC